MTAENGDEPRWLSPAEQQAWRGLQRMQFQLNALLHHQLSADSGISLADYVVLVVLTEQPDGRMRAFELGRELGWEKSRLSHHIRRMAERGLVARERCEDDRRGAVVAITDHGRAVIEAAAPGHVAAVRRYFVDRTTPEQLASLAALTAAVNAHLAPVCDVASPTGSQGSPHAV